MKKIIAFIVVCSMLLSSVACLSASAASVEYVNTAAELMAVRDNINAGIYPPDTDIVLNADIDLRGVNWEPIQLYTGHFYGNGYSITNLYIDPYRGYTGGTYHYFSSLNNIGFISEFNSPGEIDNLTILIDKVEGHHVVGGFAGIINGGYIHDCHIGVDTENPEAAGVIIGIAAVGGFAGTVYSGLAGRSFNGFKDYGVLGGSTLSTISKCTTDYPLKIRAVTEDVSDRQYPYSVYMNPVAPYATAEDKVYAAVSNNPHYPIPSSVKDVEGCYVGGMVGLSNDGGCVLYKCVNSAYVCGHIIGVGGMIGYTLYGAMIRECSNSAFGYVAGGDRFLTRYDDETTPYFGTCPYLTELPRLSLDHSLNDENYYSCNGSIGGIVGACGGNTLIEDCSNNGAVEGEGSSGGIAGSVLTSYAGSSGCIYARITNCFNTGAVLSDGCSGGIAGDVGGYDITSIPQNMNCRTCVNTAMQTPSGCCDNVIENCYNVGYPMLKANNGGIVYTYGNAQYGGIAATNGGAIRNCYSLSPYFPVSICSINSGYIDHCFGLTQNGHDTSSASTTGICSNYGQFNDVHQTSGYPLELISSGIMSGSVDLMDELNAWVNYYGQYFYNCEFSANFPYRRWRSDIFYDPFGEYFGGATTNDGSYPPNPVIFTLDYAGGVTMPGVVSNLPQPQTGRTLSVSNVTPVRTGYVFVGWSETDINPTVRYLPGQTINLTANQTLYAVWALPFNIYYCDGNNIVQIQNVGRRSIISNIMLWKEGFRFEGWSLTNGATVPQYQPGDAIIGITGDVYLYAVWKESGGSGSTGLSGFSGEAEDPTGNSLPESGSPPAGSTSTFTITTTEDFNFIRLVETVVSSETSNYISINKNDACVQNDDGTYTWTVSVPLTLWDSSAESETHKFSIMIYSGEYSSWVIDGDDEITYNVVKYEPEATYQIGEEEYGPYSIIDAQAAPGKKLTYTNITVITTDDVSKIRLTEGDKKGTVYSRTSKNVECTENGDGTLTWVIGYRFITAGTFDVKVECRGDSWEDCSSKTVTATIYNTAKELANATA